MGNAANKALELLEKVDLVKVKETAEKITAAVVAVGGVLVAIGQVSDRLSLREKFARSRKARRTAESEAKSSATSQEVPSSDGAVGPGRDSRSAAHEGPRVVSSPDSPLAHAETGSLPN